MSKYERFAQEVRGQRVAVLGIARSNTPLIRLLAGLGVRATAFDRQDEAGLAKTTAELALLGVEFSLGTDYLKRLSEGFDWIFRTPVIRPDLPELQAAVLAGAQLSSEMELFFSLCEAPIYAVTGSDGKTTTTTLISEMLRQGGHRVFLGGNIGAPLIDQVMDIHAEDRVVVELSSFQLMTMKHGPNVGVITNLTPNHLDWHRGMQEYITAKSRIWSFQQGEDRLVLNRDNALTAAMAEKVPSQVIFFSSARPLDEGAYLDGERLLVKGRDGKTTEICRRSDVFLPGVHNIENILAAAAAVSPEVPIEAIRRVATNFTGVEHRLEFIRELRGVRYYNDSIATTPTRTAASLRSFNVPLIVIAGGYDKKIPFEELAEVVCERVQQVVLLGKTAEQIAQAIAERVACGGRDVPLARANSLEEALELANQHAQPGSVVVLSPACAAFDMFRDFAERGQRFKELVHGL